MNFVPHLQLLFALPIEPLFADPRDLQHDFIQLNSPPKIGALLATLRDRFDIDFSFAGPKGSHIAIKRSHSGVVRVLSEMYEPLT